MGFIFVIEHMEEDEQTQKSIPPWVELEYAHMRILAGQDAQIYFTHLSAPSRASLSVVFDGASDDGSLAKVSCFDRGVQEVIASEGISLDKVCLLDPKAESELSPEDGDGRFQWFLFGGILGDDPPRDRTAELRVLGFSSRHLGPVQMTTDTALGVTRRVVHDKVPLGKIPYIDYPTISFNAKESVEMPFRYIADAKDPLLPPGMRELLYKDLDKGFDF